jgi:glucose/arabinose dehydrogenase
MHEVVAEGIIVSGRRHSTRRSAVAARATRRSRVIRLPRRRLSFPTIVLLAWMLVAQVGMIPGTHPATAAAVTTAAFNPANVSLGISLVKSGFSSPVLVTNAGDGSGRLFVVEQTGRIRILKGGTLLATPFLDLHTAITCCGERGLLGLAFHPSYPKVPYFYVNFTDTHGNTAIDRFTVSSNPDVANRQSGFRVLTITQPYANHNGGDIAFGRDGYLYIGMGDGGSAGDPGNRAQSLSSLLGKMLRIDVNHRTSTRNYVSPATNPYVGKTGLDEIWARGLRNPWRWSFDRATGNLWIGDVGQDRYEEVDRSLVSGSTPAGRGLNYGWRVLEARACYNPSSGCSTSGKTMPLIAYAHTSTGTDNCAVTGGYVYRGTAYPVLVGGYVYGDYCSGRIWVVSAGASSPATGTLVRSDTASPHLAISSFGESESGELYVCDLNGAVYRITAKPKA